MTPLFSKNMPIFNDFVYICLFYFHLTICFVINLGWPFHLHLPIISSHRFIHHHSFYRIFLSQHIPRLGSSYRLVAFDWAASPSLSFPNLSISCSYQHALAASTVRFSFLSFDYFSCIPHFTHFFSPMYSFFQLCYNSPPPPKFKCLLFEVSFLSFNPISFYLKVPLPQTLWKLIYMSVL